MSVVVIGGGPAGLMAAETILQAGIPVDLFDAMPTVGRKFLLAGRGGLNLTHAEPESAFGRRYLGREAEVAPWLDSWGPLQVRWWAEELGIETFVGSSQRVFPHEMKAAPLLRSWLRRLRAAGLRIHVRHRWEGWNDEGQLRFTTPDGEKSLSGEATVLALGGGSWPQLGSTGAWTTYMAARGVAVAPLKPANCGFELDWSPYMREHHAGEPLKAVALRVGSASTPRFARRGEMVVTEYGLEGSLIYAASALLRDLIETEGQATIYLDLAPDRSLQRLAHDLAQPRGRRSWPNHLRRATGLQGVKVALLHERLPPMVLADPDALAVAIKALPLTLLRPRPLAEAISSAGGITFDELDEGLMLHKVPGVFCAGEMIDWEAPTGGYLLTACFASGKVAGAGVIRWLGRAKID